LKEGSRLPVEEAELGWLHWRVCGTTEGSEPVVERLLWLCLWKLWKKF